MAKENKCPFCGSNGRLKMEPSNFGNPTKLWYVQCEICGATGPKAFDPKAAAENWKRRADNGTE